MVAICQNLKRLSKIMLAKPFIFLVPEVGIEPTRGCPRGILSLNQNNISIKSH
jgi:hypothetical protein